MHLLRRVKFIFANVSPVVRLVSGSTSLGSVMNAAWPISLTGSAWMLLVFTVTGVMVQVMMKRKGHKKHEPQNLKRFRASVEKFTQDQSTTGTKTNDSDDEGLHNSGSLVRQKSRKLRRKEERKLKKMRKDAFQRHVTVRGNNSLFMWYVMIAACNSFNNCVYMAI